MWPDLYRCSVTSLVLLCTCAANIGLGQQLQLTPGTSVSQEFVDAPEMAHEFQPMLPSQSAAFLNAGTLDRLHEPILRQDLKINGSQSCATSNCHAGPRPGVSQPSARRGSEYQIWIENDPHAQSWRTICGDESVAMMRRLGIMVGDDIVDQAGFDNCLACHNSVKRFSEARNPRQAQSLLPHADSTNTFLREGVGCSGCHGPSERWAGTHFQLHWSPHGATSQGFVEAGDLYVRARMCASCHVGDKDRDMNHDIIAAGHPTLRYELATFHAWQPKHWRDAEADDKTFYEAQLWLAGQVAATDASLSLLEARTTGSHTVSEWPELAAYDCASCHHNLGLDNARDPFDDSRNATAIYSGWNDAGLRWLVDYRVQSGEAAQEDHELIAALDAVKAAMENYPTPDPQDVADVARHARQRLAQWFDGTPGQHERHTFRSDRLGQVVASAAGKQRTFATWETAVQFYLAAVAARESWPGGWNAPVKNVADQMRSGLRYPEMIDISRFARSNGRSPTATRSEAMALGIELAGWLGPVEVQWMGQDDDRQVTEQLRRQLNDTIERINQRWQRLRQERIEQHNVDQPRLDDDRPDAPAEPAERPMTREELREELRKRREARDSLE